MISTKLRRTMPRYLKCKFFHCLSILDVYLNFDFRPRCGGVSSSLPDRGITANFTFHLFQLITSSLMNSSFLKKKNTQNQTFPAFSHSLPFRSRNKCSQLWITTLASSKSGRAGSGGSPGVAPDLWSCHQWPAVIYQHLIFPLCSIKHA